MSKYNPGDKFNRLTLIEHLGAQRARFRCDCGRDHEASIGNWTSSQVKSCGCLLIDAPKTRKKDHYSEGGLSKKHPQLYSVWYDMIKRCYNPTSTVYKWYGGSGIAVCDRWRHGIDHQSDFSCFVSDMAPRPIDGTLDRIDPHGDYTPENCRWQTIENQQRNRRKAPRNAALPLACP